MEISPHDESEQPSPVREPLRWGILGLAAVLAWLTFHYLPLDPDLLGKWKLSAPAIRSGAAVFVVIALLWLTEALPLAVTSLLAPVLGCLIAGQGVESSLVPFADPIVFLFMGGFFMAAMLHVHGLDAWLAGRVIAAAKGRFFPAACALILLTAGISVWISNTATAAMMLPLGLGLVKGLEVSEGERKRAEMFLLLGLGFAASIGGVGSLVGTPPNGIAAKELGLNFMDWFRYGLPLLALWLPALIAVLMVCYKPQRSWKFAMATEQEKEKTGWTRPQWLAASIFLITVGLWLASTPLAAAFGIKKGMDTLIVLMASIAIFATGTLSWQQGQRSVEWGVLLLFGGGLFLGKLLEDTGCSSYVAQWFAVKSEGWPLFVLLLVLITLITVLSEVASNTAVATLMVPIFAKIAVGMGLAPAKLVIPVALAASCGFMLPVATPPNALIYGTGRVPRQEMQRAGLRLDIVCILLLTLLSYLCF